jgi:7-cyano-7-deazaguanine synthase
MINKKAVILLSGGLDSTTILALAMQKGYDCYALSFSYGQRHGVELEFARNIAESYNVIEHKIMSLDLRAFGGSALTADIAVPTALSVDEITADIPVTYVPARNTIFLSFALAYAEVIGAFDIFIGVNAVDYSGYPDCRPAFIEAFEAMANLATAAGVSGAGITKIHTPLINLSKAEIIRLGLELGVDYSKTISCYNPSVDGIACGECHACLLRAKGFAEASVNNF